MRIRTTLASNVVKGSQVNKSKTGSRYEIKNRSNQYDLLIFGNKFAEKLPNYNHLKK